MTLFHSWTLGSPSVESKHGNGAETGKNGFKSDVDVRITFFLFFSL